MEEKKKINDERERDWITLYVEIDTIRNVFICHGSSAFCVDDDDNDGGGGDENSSIYDNDENLRIMVERMI